MTQFLIVSVKKYIYASVVITVGLDWLQSRVLLDSVIAVPKVQFRDAVNVVDENAGQVLAIVYRSGDVSYRSTVRCYSRQGTAQVMMDFNERPNTDASIITFLPGGGAKHGRCFNACFISPTDLTLI